MLCVTVIFITVYGAGNSIYTENKLVSKSLYNIFNCIANVHNLLLFPNTRIYVMYSKDSNDILYLNKALFFEFI